MDPEILEKIQALLDAGVRPAQADSVFTPLGFTPNRAPRVRDLPEHVLGGYHAGNDQIMLNRQYPERLPDVLMHEMTHEAIASRQRDSRRGAPEFHELLDTLLERFKSATPEQKRRHLEGYYGQSDTTDVVAQRIGWGGYSNAAAGEIAGRTMQRAFDLARTGEDPAPVDERFPGTLDALEFLKLRFPGGN